MSLQPCLTGLTLFRRRLLRFCCDAAFRARTKEKRTISSPQLLFRMFFPEPRCQGAPAPVPIWLSESESVRPTSVHRPAAFFKGRLDAVPHRLQLQPISPLDGTPLEQRASIIHRLSGCVCRLSLLSSLLCCSSILEPTRSHFSLSGRLSRGPADGRCLLLGDGPFPLLLVLPQHPRYEAKTPTPLCRWHALESGEVQPMETS